MPYSSPKEVPDSVPEGKKEQFKEVFNSVYSDTKDEGKAMSAAWSATAKVLKYQHDLDIYSNPMQAKSKSREMGFNGAIHVYDLDGQAYYMPGPSHKEYLEAMSPDEDTSEVTEDRMEDALRVIVETILNKEESYTLPEGARNNAKKVLDWKEEHGDEVKGMTETGWRRARQIANNKTVGAETVKAMAQFNRHRKNAEVSEEHKGEPWKDAGYVAWLGWGGTTGIDWAIRTSESMEKSDLNDLQVLKVDDEHRILYGWASVTTYKGEVVVDRQGDTVKTETLVDAVNDFMEGARVGKLMHKGEQVGQILHSFPVTKEICDALGIQSDKEGWITGYKIYDDDLWNDVKTGKFAAFSLGGRGVREELDA